MSDVGRRCVNEAASTSHAPDEFLIVRDAECCRACWSCVRHCPARAIRVVHGRPEIDQARCVKCGVCVVECGNHGYVPRDDLALVRALLASERRVVAVLASEHYAAFHPMSSTEAHDALDAAGFDAVETTVLGEELVAAAYEQAEANAFGQPPYLRSTCPVVVSWVERYHPQLTSSLLTVIPPYIAQARLVKATAPEGTAVVYVSPCWARKDEIYEPRLAGAVDVAIGFDELRKLLAEPPVRGVSASVGAGANRGPQATKQISLVDGFPRSLLTERDMTNRDVVVARGLVDIDRLLTAVERGETAPRILDLLNCEGCTDGPAVNAELSVFAKRNVIDAEARREPRTAVDSRRLLSALPQVDLRRYFSPTPVLSRVPSAEEIDQVLAEGEFHSRAEVLDCGACGHDTCIAHAAAVCLGDSSWDLCFPLQHKMLLRERAEMADRALRDALTGLGNRRAFDEKLDEESARAQRYDTPLSLAMIDLDGFKEVNDRYGHPIGDQLLVLVGRILVDTLRTTDIPVRYGGDEFAIILPETTKTEAWVVAEKIRSAIADLTLHDDEGTSIASSGSIGIAAFGPSAQNAYALLAAADAALYRAKRNGRDRVELSAG